jgi:nickel transport protein
MRKRPRVWCWLIVLATSGMAYAHGMSHEVTKKEAVMIAAEYDDGEPVSYAEVKIYSPEGGRVEYQNGRTDKKGRFAFLPDRAGEWKINIDGGMGHFKSTVFVVDEAMDIRMKENTGRTCPRWQAVVTGISIIFGLFGLISLCYGSSSLGQPKKQDPRC